MKALILALALAASSILTFAAPAKATIVCTTLVNGTVICQ